MEKQLIGGHLGGMQKSYRFRSEFLWLGRRDHKFPYLPFMVQGGKTLFKQEQKNVNWEKVEREIKKK